MHDCGVPSTMLTGQECIADDDSRITASTIEMADFSEEYDIAVIDEAQLTADRRSRPRALLDKGDSGTESPRNPCLHESRR